MCTLQLIVILQYIKQTTCTIKSNWLISFSTVADILQFETAKHIRVLTSYLSVTTRIVCEKKYNDTLSKSGFWYYLHWNSFILKTQCCHYFLHSAFVLFSCLVLQQKCEDEHVFKRNIDCIFNYRRFTNILFCDFWCSTNIFS